MNVLHILNVADWALVCAGVATTLLMMLIGGHEPSSRSNEDTAPEGRRSSKTGR